MKVSPSEEKATFEWKFEILMSLYFFTSSIKICVMSLEFSDSKVYVGSSPKSL